MTKQLILQILNCLLLLWPRGLGQTRTEEVEQQRSEPQKTTLCATHANGSCGSKTGTDRASFHHGDTEDTEISLRKQGISATLRGPQ